MVEVKNMRNDMQCTPFFLSCMLAFCVLFARGEAAGQIQDTDFSYRGISLGDAEQSLKQAWGEEDTEGTQMVHGIHLRTFTYGDVVVSTTVAGKKVVDISLMGEAYRLRQDVRYGATSSYIFRVFGKAQRQFRDDHTCYVYDDPMNVHRHLVLNLDAEHGALLSARMTMLPLTEEDTEELARSPYSPFCVQDFARDFIEQKEIDVTALPSAAPVRLGGYGT